VSTQPARHEDISSQPVRGAGRPRGISGTCSFCGERGHLARDGACSGVVIALRLVAETGISASAAARIVGITRQSVSSRKRRLERAGGAP
jgi:hypothetical protein